VSGDADAIRAVVADWCDATREGDIERVLSLMTEDVLFLVPGAAPMQGRQAFAEGLRGVLATHAIDSKAEVLEVEAAGDLAWCRTHLDVMIRPHDGGPLARRSGHVLSAFRRNGSGRWQLARDANLMLPGQPG
jgi:uncharacterized protein (TIGR02246 family)